MENVKKVVLLISFFISLISNTYAKEINIFSARHYDSDSVHIKKTADVDGTIRQKTLSVEEGSLLTIKTEIKK